MTLPWPLILGENREFSHKIEYIWQVYYLGIKKNNTNYSL